MYYIIFLRNKLLIFIVDKYKCPVRPGVIEGGSSSKQIIAHRLEFSRSKKWYIYNDKDSGYLTETECHFLGVNYVKRDTELNCVSMVGNWEDDGSLMSIVRDTLIFLKWFSHYFEQLY